MDVVFSVCIVRERGAVGCSSYGECECFVMQMFVCLCLVCILWAVLNAAFCMTCSLLMLVEDSNRRTITEEAYSRAGLITAL